MYRRHMQGIIATPLYLVTKSQGFFTMSLLEQPMPPSITRQVPTLEYLYKLR